MKTGTAIVLAALLLAPAMVQAQQKGSIELKSVSEIEIMTTTPEGKQEKRLVDASTAKVVPGDVVVFTTYYKNTGKEPATNVVIRNPVPDSTAYLDKSAGGSNALVDFSVDGGKTYAPPEKLTVKDAAGKVLKAAAADYTHIRWTIAKPVAPGSEGSVSFRARIQ